MEPAALAVRLDNLRTLLLHNTNLLERALNKLERIEQQQETEMATIDDLTADVAAESTVTDSVVALLNGLTTEIQTLISSGSVTPAALQTLNDGIKANTAKLMSAVVANTPAKPPAPAQVP